MNKIIAHPVDATGMFLIRSPLATGQVNGHEFAISIEQGDGDIVISYRGRLIIVPMAEILRGAITQIDEMVNE